MFVRPWRRGLFGLAPIISTLIAILPLHGQEVEPTTSPTPENAVEKTAEADRVILTGSHIPTAEEVGPNPVQEITREQIENSGDRTAAEIIRQIPQTGPEGITPNNNAFGDFGPQGTASVALRGFLTPVARWFCSMAGGSPPFRWARRRRSRFRSWT